MPTNEQRADRADHALVYYRDRVLHEDDGPISQENIIDLLTDLRHLCNQQGIDFEESSKLSEIHFESEK